MRSAARSDPCSRKRGAGSIDANKAFFWGDMLNCKHRKVKNFFVAGKNGERKTYAVVVINR